MTPKAASSTTTASSAGDAYRMRPADVYTRACMPMADPDEAAAMVNALQRHATVVVQKSIAEGFGLTVAEAM